MSIDGVQVEIVKCMKAMSEGMGCHSTWGWEPRGEWQRRIDLYCVPIVAAVDVVPYAFENLSLRF